MALTAPAAKLVAAGGIVKQFNGQNDITQVCSLCTAVQDPAVDATLVAALEEAVPEATEELQLGAWAYQHAAAVHGVVEADAIELGWLPDSG